MRSSVFRRSIFISSAIACIVLSGCAIDEGSASENKQTASPIGETLGMARESVEPQKIESFDLTKSITGTTNSNEYTSDSAWTVVAQCSADQNSRETSMITVGILPNELVSPDILERSLAGDYSTLIQGWGTDSDESLC